jgi:hypothetical protein
MGDTPAHRIAYFLSNGYLYIPAEIMHSCDNPACVNPAHLKEGDRASNMADMAQKGRRKGIGTGADNGRARLTEPQVAEIRRRREAGEHLKSLAAAFGVGISTIDHITKGRTWKK